MDIGMLSIMGIIPAAYERWAVYLWLLYMTTAIVMDLLYGSGRVSITDAGALVSAVIIFYFFLVL